MRRYPHLHSQVLIIMQRSHIVIHADRAVTSRAFSQYASDELLVRSQFATIQGEGPFAGRYAYFIRLGGCNLGAKDRAGCRGCDTDFRVLESTVLTHSALLTSVFKSKAPLVVITGGEPTLQKNLVEFCRLLKTNGYKVQIETNGTQRGVLRTLLQIGVTCVISPKAADTGYGQMPPRDVVENPLAHFKFVVSSDPANEHSELPHWFADAAIPTTRLWLSPYTEYLRAYEGEVSSAWDSTLVDHEATRKNYTYAAELALSLHCNLSIQMHTWLGVA